MAKYQENPIESVRQWMIQLNHEWPQPAPVPFEWDVVVGGLIAFLIEATNFVIPLYENQDYLDFIEHLNVLEGQTVCPNNLDRYMDLRDLYNNSLSLIHQIAQIYENDLILRTVAAIPYLSLQPPGEPEISVCNGIMETKRRLDELLDRFDRAWMYIQQLQAFETSGWRQKGF